MRVLVAEDDSTSRKFLSTLLSRYGECDLAADGSEAIDAYLASIKENRPYDLICLDIMMPRVDGVKVLKAIREYEDHNEVLPHERVKIIMTTALAETSYVQHSFEIGCDAYAAKPINSKKLVGVIEELGLIRSPLQKIVR